MAKEQSAVVFGHGLAKKPAPEELIQLRLMGISRRVPAPDKGIDLVTQGLPCKMKHHANVHYGED